MNKTPSISLQALFPLLTVFIFSIDDDYFFFVKIASLKPVLTL